MSTTTSTSTAATIGPFSTKVHYYVDTELLKAVEEVKKKARQWKRDCCGKKAGKRFCESYGCSSLDELLAPLARFTAKRKRGRKAAPSAKGER